MKIRTKSQLNTVFLVVVILTIGLILKLFQVDLNATFHAMSGTELEKAGVRCGPS